MSKSTTNQIKENNNQKENKTMKNINWSAIKTNVIVFLITAIAFTILGWNLYANQQGLVKAEAAEIVKNVKVEVTPSK